MKLAWRIAGIGSILAVGCSLALWLFVHTAKRYADAARNERIVAAYNVRMRYRSSSATLFGYRFRCEYSYRVDESAYSGYGECPKSAIDTPDKLAILGAQGALTIPSATVFYDSGNPSISSLVDFGVRRDRYYRSAAIGASFATGFIVLVVLTTAPSAIKRQRRGPTVLNSAGPAIDPEENRSRQANGWSVGAGRSSASTKGEREWAATPELRSLYLQIVNEIHPDRAQNDSDLKLREKLMKDANLAYGQGDSDTLWRVLEKYRSRSTQ